MKNKFIFLSTLFFALMINTSCEKTDDLGLERFENHEIAQPIPADNNPCAVDSSYYLGYNPYPSDSLFISCHAYFESWFIDRASNECIKVGYSGCDPKGFPSEAECEQCKPCPTLNDQHYLRFFFDEHSQVSNTLDCYTNFTSWFIDGETNQCVEYEYGHCMEFGFPSEAECEKCNPVQN